MKRPVRAEDGRYHLKEGVFAELFGSRTQVMNGTAYKTSGELTKKHLMMNKWGRIVSAKKHRTAKKEKRLEKAGYFAKKGKFGYVKKTARRRGSRKMNGGALADLSPSEYSPTKMAPAKMNGGALADLSPSEYSHTKMAQAKMNGGALADLSPSEYSPTKMAPAKV